MTYTTTHLVVIDADREARMGVGRKWNMPPLGPDEVYIAQKLSRVLGVSTGDTIIVTYNAGTGPNMMKELLRTAIYKTGPDSMMEEYLPYNATRIWNSATLNYMLTVNLVLKVCVSMR